MKWVSQNRVKITSKFNTLEKKEGKAALVEILQKRNIFFSYRLNNYSQYKTQEETKDENPLSAGKYISILGQKLKPYEEKEVFFKLPRRQSQNTFIRTNAKLAKPPSPKKER